MLVTPAPWESRIHRTVVLGQWVALTVGIISSLVQTGGSTGALAGMGIAAIYVIGSTLTPEHWFHARFGSEAITLLGAVLVLVAMTITGGPGSPYLLLSMGPPTLAAVYGGLRTGLTTAFLASGLLIMVTLARGLDVIAAAPGTALYLVFVLLVGVIRRLLDEIHQHASILAEEKESATQRLERLQTIHSALIRLSEDVSAGRLNAIEVGADTLEALLERFPGSAGKLSVRGESGLVTLAARGIPEQGSGHVYQFPLETSDIEVGNLELTTPDSLTAPQLADISAGLHPVSVAFANLRLMQEIVGSAVSEERMRLAREMHDEIGPSLASLGLALDMTAMQQAARPDVAADLRVLRSNVTKLVEDVRASVADLRNAPGPTLTARIMQSIGSIDADPPVIVDLDERRPPRAAQIGDLAAIVTEAVRNAHRHSSASKVVISGQVDRAFGSCSIVDDGVGFDPDTRPEGHYGLIGMKERADKVGASLKVESKPGVGTAVTVEWGSR